MPMNRAKPLTIRSCPVCRVAMLRSDAGWNCPRCDITIVEGSAKPDVEVHETCGEDRAAGALHA
jgi:ribosomal protein L37AE/L43A